MYNANCLRRQFSHNTDLTWFFSSVKAQSYQLLLHHVGLNAPAKSKTEFQVVAITPWTHFCEHNPTMNTSSYIIEHKENTFNAPGILETDCVK